MVPAEEESFPRGCRKVAAPKKRNVHVMDNLFAGPKEPKAKRARKDKKASKDFLTTDAFYSQINVSGTLAYNKMQEGMVILSCIRHITNFSLEIEFPGLTFGQITITNISDPLTTTLSKKLEAEDEDTDFVLKSMFKVGQFLPAKIIRIGGKEQGVLVDTSTNPTDINSGKRHDAFRKGMLMWGCIQSTLEHGYEINVGVKNCRVFLPSKNIDQDKNYVIGEPLWCVVHKCDNSNEAATLRVSAKLEHIHAAKNDEITSLHEIIPGMQVEFVTNKITTHGIQGKFLENFFGYVDETQLRKPLDTLSDYQEGKLIKAYVLFIEPSTNITHLSLRGFDNVPSGKYTIGDNTSGIVLAKTHNGIFLKLPNKEKAFITNKRLMNSLNKSASVDLVEAVRLKYPPGSKHSCRILDYNHISRIYVCTTEQQLIKQDIFSANHAKLGELLTVQVDRIKPNGLVVSYGSLRGFVPNLHLSNMEYNENIKKKFVEGRKLRVRILNIAEDGNILFTLKQTLVDSDKCLVDLNTCKAFSQYPGVVVQTKPTGVLVTFYGNIKGWIGRKQLGGEDVETSTDPSKYFFRGQVVNVWILAVKEARLFLSLREPTIEDKIDNKIQIGHKVTATVVKVLKDGLEVRSEMGVKGIVPVNHLSQSLSLCSVLLRTYKRGDTIKLLCVSNTRPVIFSRREYMAFMGRKYKLCTFSSIKKGTLIRCRFDSICESGIYVYPLIKDFEEKILILTKNVVGQNEAIPDFKEDQAIVTKVQYINVAERRIVLTAKFSDVFDCNIESVTNWFKKHLKDLEIIKAFGKANNWELCEYAPGDRLECKVRKCGDQGGCLVSLPNGANALVAPRLCPDKVQVGQTLEGVYLSQNFAENFAEVCLKPRYSQKINKCQNGLLNDVSVMSCIAEKLLVKNDYIIGVMHQTGNRQLVSIPLYFHENDFTGCLSYYEDSRFILSVTAKIGMSLVGVRKRLFLRLEKGRAKITKPKTGVKVKKPVEVDVKDELSSEDSEIDEETNDQDSGMSSSEEGSQEELSSEEENMDAEDELNDGNDLVEEMDVAEADENEVMSSSEESDIVEVKSDGLPGISSFFANQKAEESSSDDDETEIETTQKKKKKLSAADRAEVARIEEERILKIETELADSSAAPQSAEQFDRLLLANPNSSELWTKYISFHIANTEVEKARGIAKIALETVDKTLVEEKFNIWLVYLNLENMFGTKESFDSIFEDAVRYNDSLDVYLQTIKMLAEAGKLNEMEEKVRKVRNKHKQNSKMWLEVARVYYTIKNFKEARNIKNAAFKSIQDKKTQLSLIIQFAVMEFKMGEAEQGSAIFENLINAYPKNVNICCIYVDQLVKKDKIEEARKILERSTSAKLPVKNMRTLFGKFRAFEEKYGTTETVEIVKKKAKEYVDSK